MKRRKKSGEHFWSRMSRLTCGTGGPRSSDTDFIEKMLDYTERLTKYEYADAVAIEKALLKLCPGNLRKDIYERVCNITNDFKKRHGQTSGAPLSDIVCPVELEDNQSVTEQLLPIFFDKSKVKEFLNNIKKMKPRDICRYVRTLVRKRIISDTSYKSPLWHVLHHFNLYPLTLRNWTKQVSI